MKALDIAIGLVLIYFLYSLLITIIGEMIATWLGMRARLLRQGLDNMLNDKQVEKLKIDFSRWIKDIFMVEPAEFKFTTAAKFYNEPAIRSLAKRGANSWYSLRNTKPSYISKSNYAGTVMGMLEKKGKGIHQWDRIMFAIQTNALHLEPDTIQKFRDIMTNANGKYQLFVKGLEDSYDEMMDRVNGWYKRKIGLILFWVGFVLCCALNVDTFQIVSILSKDAKARDEMVRLAEAAIKDSTAITKILSSTEDSIKNYEFLKESYKKVHQDISQTESLMAKGWKYNTISDSVMIDINHALLLQKSDALNKTIKRLNTETKNKKYNSQQLKQILDSVHNYKQDSLRLLMDEFEKVSCKKNVVEILDYKLAKGSTEEYNVHFLKLPNFVNKVIFIACQLNLFDQKLWGLILSALALSLGANFWFDLLKKLVAIRGAGVKPEEKPQTKPDPAQSEKVESDGLHIDNPDPFEKVISENRKYWEGLPGVIGINRGFFEIDGIKKPCIEIIVEENLTSPDIPNEIETKINSISHKITVKIKKGEKGSFADNDVPLKGHLFHPSTKKYGTAAGLVINNKTGKYSVLTCGHVVQMDESSYIDSFKTDVSIVENTTSTPTIQNLGKIRNMILSSYVDAAIIDLTSDTDLNALKANYDIDKITRYREVSRPEEGKTEVEVHTRRGALEMILTNADMNFAFVATTQFESRFFDLIAMSDQKSEFKKRLTEPGDSGALITDKNKIPIGILIGHAKIGDQWISFGVKLKDIFESLQIKTITS